MTPFQFTRCDLHTLALHSHWVLTTLSSFHPHEEKRCTRRSLTSYSAVPTMGSPQKSTQVLPDGLGLKLKLIKLSVSPVNKQCFQLRTGLMSKSGYLASHKEEMKKEAGQYQFTIGPWIITLRARLLQHLHAALANCTISPAGSPAIHCLGPCLGG